MKKIERLKQSFKARFKKDPQIIVRSPGRVEVIGGHTDYNDGWVLPMAIEREVLIAATPRSDDIVRVYSEYFDEEVSFRLSSSLAPGSPKWANYAKGVASLLIRAGKELIGEDIYLTSEIPAGGGLSSSAAIEVGYAKALLAAIDDFLDPLDLAKLCQEAEHNFANSPCGIMDQTVCILGKKGNLLLLDCRSLAFRYIPLPEEAVILIADSKIKHDLGESQYPIRRRQCTEAVEILKSKLPDIKALRDITLEELNANKDLLTDILYKRARHVVGENNRVLRMAEALEKKDLKTAGDMMIQSHISLRDDYEVSCDELDLLVDLAMNSPGVFGARMSGGGFGGCIVALVEKGKEQSIEERIKQGYKKRFGQFPDVFTTGAATGAEVLEK